MNLSACAADDEPRTAALQQIAAQPATPGKLSPNAKLRNIFFSGSLCPTADSLSVMISSDRTGATALFSESLELTQQKTVKKCSLSVELEVSPGFQFIGAKFASIVFAQVEMNAQATASLGISFDRGERNVTRLAIGPVESGAGSYPLLATTREWSPCGATSTIRLNVDVDAAVSSTTAETSAYLVVNTVDMSLDDIKWRECIVGSK